MIELVLWTLILIPTGLFFLCKWAYSFLSKIFEHFESKTTTTTLDDIDQMDGWNFEHFVAKLLKQHGFSNVQITRGSGDFGVDVIATRSNKKWAFQCKNYQSKLGISPIQEVYSGAPKYNAQVCVVITNSYFTPHAQELAKTLGVQLWDRTMLTKLIRTNNTPAPQAQNPTLTASIQKPTILTQTPHTLNQAMVTIPPQTSPQNQKIYQTKNKEDHLMATTLGAGKYIFGVNIPEGVYNLRAISGSGWLEFKRLIDGSWEDESIQFGVVERCAKSYHGLSLPKNKYFEISGDVIFEITKATMIEIE